MLPPIPIQTAVLLTAASTGAVALTFGIGLRPWLRLRRVQFVLGAIAFLLAGSLMAWDLGPLLGRWDVASLGVDVFFAVMLVLLPVTVLLPLSAVLRRAAGPPPAELKGPAPVITRRSVLGGVAIALPTLGIGMNASAVAASARTPRIRELALGVPKLPRALHGLRIAQLSDLHLGASKNLRDLERVLCELERARPDILVLTGDIAEDLTQLAPALRLASQLRPRFGTFAVLGNHEYLRGIQYTRPVFERADLKLLVNEHVTVDVGPARLTIAGIDDPIVAGDSNPLADAGSHHVRTIDRALDGANASAPVLLLSHRPEAFDVAAARGVGLTLSGHTHGGQLGYNGRSLLEGSARSPFRYPWGVYRDAGGRALYTTSGFGHWFPYRLGCAPEVPLIVLSSLDSKGATP